MYCGEESPGVWENRLKALPCVILEALWAWARMLAIRMRRWGELESHLKVMGLGDRLAIEVQRWKQSRMT